MREVRPIRRNEADRFLRLLCSVFGLEVGRAEHVFYNEPLFDLGRKWALFEGGEMLSILTTSPLEFGWGDAIGIAGVATAPHRRREGLAEELLTAVLASSSRRDEGAAYLFAVRPELYARLGFEVLDQAVRSPIRTCRPMREEPLLRESDVRRLYDTWSHANPNRLRRDAQRWKLWNFNARQATPFLGGYCCAEGTLLREVLAHELATEWPLESDMEWFGLTSMAHALGVPLAGAKPELLLMGRNAPASPAMFMTDQF